MPGGSFISSEDGKKVNKNTAELDVLLAVNG
jgi:hypothetical protein